MRKDGDRERYLLHFFFGFGAPRDKKVCMCVAYQKKRHKTYWWYPLWFFFTLVCAKRVRESWWAPAVRSPEWFPIRWNSSPAFVLCGWVVDKLGFPGLNNWVRLNQPNAPPTTRSKVRPNDTMQMVIQILDLAEHTRAISHNFVISLALHKEQLGHDAEHKEAV